MYYIILYLGLEINVLTEQTLERMDKSKLGWSLVKLMLANQQNIISFGRTSGVTVDVDGVRTTTNFEFIEIVDTANPFPTLLGFKWAIDNKSIINMKKRHMIFEGGDIRVIA